MLCQKYRNLLKKLFKLQSAVIRHSMKNFLETYNKEIYIQCYMSPLNQYDAVTPVQDRYKNQSMYQHQNQCPVHTRKGYCRNIHQIDLHRKILLDIESVKCIFKL